MSAILKPFDFFRERLSPVRLIVSSFFFLIISGTILLSLPICSRDGQSTNFIDSLFISTSCTCVTGLTPFDTYLHWSTFGQIVMLILIQLGGLGLVSFTTGFTLLIKRKMGFRDYQVAQAYTNGNIIDIPKLLKTILLVSFSFEALGAILLSFKFVPLCGLHGLWVSLFISISAYCNAGFDILGFIVPDASLTMFQNDHYVSIIICILIILGGIGFVVMNDIYTKLHDKVKKTNMHPHFTVNTNVVLLTTAILLFIGTIMFFFIEYNYSLKDLSLAQKITASFFQSTTSRTAGYATIYVQDQLDITKVLIMTLMFIGASPSSTGGGIKTTTLFVIIATVVSVLKGKSDTTIGKHRLNKSIVYKAICITVLAVIVVLISIIILETVEAEKGLASIDLMFEAVSAFGTVGLSAGITPLLSDISKAILCITMFVGRVGPMTLFIALTLKNNNRFESILPEGKIIVG